MQTKSGAVRIKAVMPTWEVELADRARASIAR
jgi:hypothetical protein